MAEATALATLEGLGTVPTESDIEQIRKAGQAMIAYKKEVRELYRTIEGLEWGSGSSVVKGSDLSQATRYAFAEFCRITRANPMYHVDMMGSRPYLNANYWSDLINSDPHFHHFEQRDLSPSVEQALRDRARQHREIAAQLEGPEAAKRLAMALDLEEEANDIALARAQWSAPAWAQAVVETTIVRFINSAPLEAIKAGRILDLEPFLIRVTECNWAGGRPPTTGKRRDGTTYSYDPDPVGNAEPAKTARTRSLRRAAVKAFAAWMQRYEEQIRKAEEAIEAEFEIIRSDQASARASLPSAGAPQAIRAGSGEPEAAAAVDARPLPVEGAAPGAPAAAAPSGWDRDAARKRLFATFREAGIEGDPDRKAWARTHGFPESTRYWTEGDFERAIEILVGPVREKFMRGCGVLGADPDAIAREVLGRPAVTLGDFERLVDAVNARLDAAEPELAL
jgi:hypothetical protein